MEGSEMGLATQTIECAKTFSKKKRKTSDRSLDNPRRVIPLTFPCTRNVLWDHRASGAPVKIHVSHYRNPLLIIEEKALRLAQRFAQDSGAHRFNCVLIGSVTTECDGEGIRLNVDRIDLYKNGLSGTNLQETSEVSGEFYIPCQIQAAGQSVPVSTEDLISAIKVLHKQCTSKGKVNISQFLAPQAFCSFHSTKQSNIFYIDFEMLAPSTVFRATPISPVPIVPTALSKNLGGPLSLSDLQGESKMGYLTMDHTRKLLLILESDPKAATLPLVGIWISGVASIHEPFVWTSCLHYIYSDSLKERVCIPPETFLVVLYSSLHSKPEFYDCVTSNGKSTLSFDLHTCHEVIHLPKESPSRPRSPIEVELIAVESGSKKETLDAALENSKDLLSSVIQKSSGQLLVGSPVSAVHEDIIPRSSPAPHLSKVSMIQPAVPEVSVLFDENDQYVQPLGTKTYNPTAFRGKVPSKDITKEDASDNNQTVDKQPHRMPLKPVNRDMSTVPVSHIPISYGPPHTGTDSASVVSCSGYPVHSYPQPVYHSHGSPQYPAPTKASNAYTVPPYPVSHWHQYPAFPPNPGYSGQGNPHTFQGHWLSPHSHLGSADQLPPSTYPQRYVMPQRSLPRPPLVQGHPTMTYSPWPQSGMAQHHQTPHIGPPLNLGIQPLPITRLSAPEQIQPTSKHSQNDILPPPHPEPASPPQPADWQSSHPRNVNTNSTHITSLQQEASAVANKLPSTLSHNSNSQREQHESEHHSVENSPIPSQTKSNTPNGDTNLYDLLKQQDEQLRHLRAQLQGLLQKQPQEDEAKYIPIAMTLKEAVNKISCAVNTSTHWPEEITLNTKGDDSGISQSPQELESTQSKIKKSKPKQHHSGQRSGSLIDQNPLFRTQEHRMSDGNINDEAYCGSSKQPDQESPRCTRGVSEVGKMLANDTLSFGDFQLAHIQDRTEESILSELLVDMPDYGSLSPEKSGCNPSSSGYDDFDNSNRSPVFGESVSMYHVQNQSFVENPEGDSGDTGLGDSQPETSLLFKDQRVFYENLIGRVQNFLHAHNTSGENFPPNDTVQSEPVLSKSTIPQHHNRSLPHDLYATRVTPDNQKPDQRQNQLDGEESPQHDSNQENTHHLPHKRNMHAIHTEQYRYQDDLPNNENRETVTKPQMESSLTPKTLASHGALITDIFHKEDISVCSVPELDIEAATRKQLERMGICFDTLNDDAGSGNSTLIFDPAVLPRINYISMVIDSECDLSSDADALAMKYLSDEQLSELAKMRLKGHQNKGHHEPDKALDRLVTSNIVHPESPSLNHMSFATQKYLQKYGLLENEGEEQFSGPQNNSDTEESSKEGGKAPAVLNIKDFIQKLTESSFMQQIPTQKPWTENSEYSDLGESHNSKSLHKDHEVVNPANENFRVPTESLMRQFSTTSDTTQYHSPGSSPRHHPYPTSFDNQALRVFGSGFNQGHKGKNLEGGVSSENPQNRILDIKRLKELPKLL